MNILFSATPYIHVITHSLLGSHGYGVPDISPVLFNCWPLSSINEAAWGYVVSSRALVAVWGEGTPSLPIAGIRSSKMYFFIIAFVNSTTACSLTTFGECMYLFTVCVCLCADRDGQKAFFQSLAWTTHLTWELNDF